MDKIFDRKNASPAENNCFSCHFTAYNLAFSSWMALSGVQKNAVHEVKG